MQSELIETDSNYDEEIPTTEKKTIYLEGKFFAVKL